MYPTHAPSSCRTAAATTPDRSIKQLGKSSFKPILLFHRFCSSLLLDTAASNNGDALRTVDDIRSRLIEEHPLEHVRIDAALTLTNGLSLSKQYELARAFLAQVQQEQAASQNHTFVNGSFVNEFD